MSEDEEGLGLPPSGACTSHHGYRCNALLSSVLHRSGRCVRAWRNSRFVIGVNLACEGVGTSAAHRWNYTLEEDEPCRGEEALT